MKSPRIALVHDWLTNFAGAEQVLLALTELFPDAPIYTSLHNPIRTPQFNNSTVIPSYLQKIPGANKKHQIFTPFMPAAFESFDLKAYDLIISTGCGYSKGVITHPGQKHLSYCHTPPRYIWKIGGDNRGEGIIRSRISHNFRIWDVASSSRPDLMWGNSNVVVKRINKIYRRSADVLYPPVQTNRFTTDKTEKGEYFLSVGRLVAYKRVDLIISACIKTNVPLLVVGEGPEENNLKKLAANHPNIIFKGRVDDSTLTELYANAKGFLFAAEEDFGIVPVEAMSAGVPVIAYAKGGATETVKEGISGIFFKEQTSDSLALAITSFTAEAFNSKEVQKWASQFDSSVFKRKVLEVVKGLEY